jgi:cytochrome c553
MTQLSDFRVGFLAAGAVLALTAGFWPQTAAADSEAGFAKSAICASCHGPVGVSPVPTYPNIAGQNPLYLQYALRRYRAGERGGEQAGMMYTVTQALSDTDIADLASYYSSLQPGTSYGVSMAAGGGSVDGFGLRLSHDP